MEILHFEDLGDTSVFSECSLGVNLVIDNFLKAIVPLVMDIAFCRFGGYECRLAANAVVLVIGGYQISIAKYLRGYLPSYKI